MAEIVTDDGDYISSNFETEDQLRALAGGSEPAAPVSSSEGSVTPGAGATPTEGEADGAAASEAPAEPDTGPARDDAGKFRKQKPHERIAELTYHRREAERREAAERQRAEAAEAELHRLRGGQSAQTPAPQPLPPTDRFPEYAEFLAQPGNGEKSYEEYIDARSDWRTERQFARYQASQQAAAWRQQQDESMTAHNARVETFRQQTPDYDAVAKAGADVPISAAMQVAILASEHGPELVYHLAKHPQEATQLAHETAHLDPSVASLLVQRTLEGMIRPVPAQNGSGSKAAPRTSAPAPIRPVGSGAVASDGPPDDSASDDEHVAYWNRKEREARRRPA